MKQSKAVESKRKRLKLALALALALTAPGLWLLEKPPAAAISSAPAREAVLPPGAHSSALALRFERPPEPMPADLVSLPVSGDSPAFVMVGLPGAPARAFVYLHGLCGDPRKAEPWASTLRAHGTLIAPVGSARCQGQPSLHYWSADYRYLDYRIVKSVRSVGEALRMRFDESEIVLIGYSQGAERAEDLAWLHPERYTQVVLMSGPRVPSYDKLKRSRGVAITRGTREYHRNYRLAGQRLARAGLPALYRELPGAAHGDFGDGSVEVMSGIFEWLAEQPRE